MTETRAKRGSPPPAIAFARHVFGTAEVARILGITPERVRSMVRAGLCRPQTSGHALHFGFQDLVLLRTARGLLDAAISPRRVRYALTRLAQQLPPERPLSGVRIYAAGRQVLARDQRAAWRADSGQLVFSFAVDELARRAGVVVPVRKRRLSGTPASQDPAAAAAAWFEHALAQEEQGDTAAARAAYERALQLDPCHADACINLGRLVHEAGDPAEAARLYQLALQWAEDDPVAHYNLALALEDQHQLDGAVTHYQRAVGLDPEFADAHFNLGRLLDRLGHHTQAIRHLLTYRKLTRRT